MTSYYPQGCLEFIYSTILAIVNNCQAKNMYLCNKLRMSRLGLDDIFREMRDMVLIRPYNIIIQSQVEILQLLSIRNASIIQEMYLLDMVLRYAKIFLD